MKAKATGAPIAVQIGLLIALCLVAAQIIALAVVGLSPPPAPQIYRLTEIATALQGGSLQPSLGSTLERTLADRPPPGRNQNRRQATPDTNRQQSPMRNNRTAGLGRSRIALAVLLGVEPSRIRILRPPPSWPSRIMTGRILPDPNQSQPRRIDDDRGPPRPQAPDDSEPRLGFDRRPSGGFDSAPRAFPAAPAQRLQRLSARAPEMDIVGGFIASLQRDDGLWVVVKPQPEPFPNDWQRKEGLWMIGCLLLSAPAAWGFARRITAPIDRFAEAAARLGRDPQARPISLDGPAEIGKAALAFNDMQVRLKRYVDDRTAMVGAISHDLRTPLARMRFKLEAKTPDPAAILSDIVQMEAMIGSVLAFIRDASVLARRDKLDLLSVVEVVVDDAALVGRNATLIKAQPLTVEGDPIALQRLLANLLDNALKYGGVARVSMAQRNDQAVVEIEDDGPGMAPADLARAFEPFYRANVSRNLDKGGVGLGLAVARSLARTHGGDVDLVSRPGGLTARVTLPLA